MKFLLSLFIYFILINSAVAADDPISNSNNSKKEVNIIELHNQSIDQGLMDASKDVNNLEDNTDNKISTSNIIIEEQIIDDDLSNSNNLTTVNVVGSDENNLKDGIKTLPDFWENADKEEMLFLLDKMLPTHSKVLNNIIVKSLILDSSPPHNFTEDEFNHIRIINLIKLGKRKNAFDMINIIHETSDHLDFYNSFILNYFFSTYELEQACDFSNSIDRKTSKINDNFLLKVDIFCAFLNNKVDEANFLNALLEDANDHDEYFQKIFLSLKNSEKSKLDIDLFNYNKNTMPLYSAMIRVGDMPLNHKFLEHDSANLAMPIVLSRSSDISLRLKAAHQAYQQGIFSAESLSALYQTVDFNYEELSSSESIPTKLYKNVEAGMAYFFQKANIQLLPITRIQTLVDFWNFAENQDLSMLAYDISRNLIDTLEPSPELSDYGIEVAKAYIYNNNFESANRWIMFAESYKSDDSSFSKKIQSLKLLYNLKHSTDDNQFINILLDSDILKDIKEDSIKQEVFLTILSVAGEDLKDDYVGNRTLIDERSMPSRYLLNKIKNSSEIKNFGELALSVNISIIDKKWIETHPEHLRIILSALRENNIEGIFNKIVLEILEESTII